ncbi:MAG: S41 family peptidase [Candidatus Kapabacteria bacterium]|jgi:carboxyl-terminal processing protease|nr:S41 family peptidase [Candidatus Kapabacteria bacterium]
MRKYSLVIPALLIGAILGIKFQHLLHNDPVSENTDKFNKILNTSFNDYVDETDPDQLTEAALIGLMEKLDVHSLYINSEDMRLVTEEFRGSFEGIGISYKVLRDTIVIVSTIDGGPSQSAGLVAGDKIINVDAQSAVGIDRDSIPNRIKGEKGSTVKLDISRQGIDSLLVINVTRDKIPFNSVDAAFIVSQDIGLIQINRFSATTHDELSNALKKLSKQGMKRLILDLRNNPGGFLREAVLCADEFLEENKIIVYTKGRQDKGFDDIYRSSAAGNFKNITLIVLINESSASASEILSGSIQDLDRGLVVGTTSFGKGLVQRQYDLADGSAFRLTISRYHTASGRCIQRSLKNKIAYEHLAGRLELRDGSYINNSVEKLKANLLNDDISLGFIDSLPEFKTEHGRTVFGSGGITPDYIVEQDTITPLSIEIRRNSIVFDYVTNVLDYETIRNKYAGKTDDFIRNFEVNSQMIAEFKTLALSREIEWEKEMFATDYEYIKNRIKAEIARKLGGYEALLEVIGKSDKQILKAIDLFPAAEKISKMK